MKPFIMQFSPASCSQENLSLCPSFNVKDSHPNKTKDKIVVLHISIGDEKTKDSELNGSKPPLNLICS
jgi:hypothetical protein